MQKSKLGISVGLLGAAMSFACFFGGYTVAVVLAGYILLFEENAWLKRATVKSVALLFWFAILSALIYLIPNIITFISSISTMLGINFYIPSVSNISDAMNAALGIIEKILFIVLGFRALRQKTVKTPVIDSLINKYMD